MATDLQLSGIIVNEVESDSKLAEISQQEILGSNQIFFTRDGVGDDNAVGLPIGAIFASAIPIVDARVHLLDGSTISQSGIYEEFAMLVKSLVASGQPISCSQSDFDTDVLNTGNCGKFVVDDTAGTIRLPKITTFIQGLTSITNIGESLGAGIPNITGKWTSGWNVTGRGFHNLSASGAFYDSYTAGLHDGAGRIQGTDDNNTGTKGYPWFDAKRGETKSDGTIKNDVYGKSDTVQPNATQFPYYIVLASGYKSKKSLDVDNIMNEVNKNAGEIRGVDEKVNTKTTLDEVYPVGSIYLTVNAHGSPAKIFGGTWELIQGKFLLGATTGVEQTDLTNLGYSRSSNNYHYWTDSAGNRHSITPNSDNYSTVSGEVKHTLTTAEMPSHYHYVGAGANDATGYHASGSKVGHIGIWNATGYGRNSDSSGGGGAHNNMPPYYVVYIYKRVS